MTPDREEQVEATFRCALCGEVAGNVMLIPQGVLHPDALTYKAAAGTLMISYFLCRLREVVLPAGYAAVRQALMLRDIGALYGIERLWAPFYCPTCRLVYCGAHWVSEAVYEDGAWYDCTYGTCPQGHRRMIDD